MIISLLSILLLQTAYSETIDGVWRRDDGARFIFPMTHEEEFPMVYIPYEGEPVLRWGKWVDGLEGTQLSYTSPSQVRWTMTQILKDADKMRMESKNGSFTLRQIQEVNKESPILGIWTSESGNRFYPFEIDETIFVVVDRPSGNKELHIANWTTGLEGTQLQYSSTRDYTVTINASNPDVAYSQGGGRSYRWDRTYKPLPDPNYEPTIQGTWETPGGKMRFKLSTQRTGYQLKSAQLLLPQLTVPVQASWVPGLEGKQFTVSYMGTEVIGNFDPNEPNQIRSVQDGNVVLWQRSQELIAPVGDPDPSGKWSSANGILELQLENGNFISAAYLFPQMQIPLNASWKSGDEGNIFFLNHDGKMITAYYESNNPFQLRTVANGMEIIWQKMVD